MLGIARELADIGADRLMLGDTTGEADPVRAHDVVAAGCEATGLPVVAHFHDQRGSGVANALMAAAAGAEWLDVALGGIGGHQREAGVQTGDAGNVCTEDLAVALVGAGVSIGLDLDQMLAAGRLAERVLGRQLESKVQRAGLPAVLGDRTRPDTRPDTRPGQSS